MDLIKTNVPGYSKDPKSGVVVNTAKDGYRQVLISRQRLKENSLLRTRVSSMEADMAAVKAKLGII